MDRWQQHRQWLEARIRDVMRGTMWLAQGVVAALRLSWRVISPALLFLANVLAALIVIFEEWGWRPLSALLARLARFPLWAKAEQLIAKLPPYGALFVLAVPSAVLIPAKLIGVYAFATGHFFVAIAIICMAKVASTALIARIFMLTQPQLMQIGWFVRAYNAFMPWHDAWVEWVRSSWVWRYGRVLKRRAEIYLRHGWGWLRPRLQAGSAALARGMGAVWQSTRRFAGQILGKPAVVEQETRLLPPPSSDNRV